MSMLEDSISRITTSLKPDKEFIKSFVTQKTFLNGERFSFKGHEYQQFILELLTDPDMKLFITKPSQTGVSEIAYRALLALAARIPGFSMAILLPTATMSMEVMKTRIAPIIKGCTELHDLLSKDVDSATAKMFLNDSILYALGASINSSTTVINRPIRQLVLDEYSRINPDLMSTLASRQKHQAHKPVLAFSTPMFENCDIDAEMKRCGDMWTRSIKCVRCGKVFFPDFYDHVKLTGYKDDIRLLKEAHIERLGLDIRDAYLECPACERATEHATKHLEWVNTNPDNRRDQVGMRLTPFDMPEWYGCSDLIKDFVSYKDRNEFTQQVLGQPASKSTTAMDVEQIVFESEEAGPINVMGIDVGGRELQISIASVMNEHLYVHTLMFMKHKNFNKEFPALVKKWRILSGVIDYMPLTTLAAQVCQNYHNYWVATYDNSTTHNPETYMPKMKDDEGLGKLRALRIRMNPHFDALAEGMMNATITFKTSPMDDVLKEHLTGMRKIKDPTGRTTDMIWIKSQGGKTVDHLHHSVGYAYAASKLLSKASQGGGIGFTGVPLISTFKPKNSI